MSFAFLLEMGWKSALIAGIPLALAILLRSRSAADRAAVLRIGVALLLALPMVALAFPSLEIATLPPAQVETGAAPLAGAPVAAQLQDAASLAAPAPPSFMDKVRDNADLLLGLSYLAGLLLVGLHLLAGIATLRRWTEAAREVTHPDWVEALGRAGADRTPRLLVSEDVPAPLSWGWRDPVILLDPESAERTGDAEAILAHELAHIARGDWIALLGSRVAVALFWFNPLVWLLEREVGQQAEEAADSAALRQVEPARLAETLVACARHQFVPALPALGIAPSESGLARRIRAILDAGRHATPSGSAWTMAAILGCVTIATPVAAMKLVPRAERNGPAPAAPQAPAAPEAPAVRHAPVAPRAPTPAAAPAAPMAMAATRAPLPPLPPQAAEVERTEAPRPPAPASTPIAPQQPQAPRAPVPPSGDFHGLSEDDAREIRRDLAEAIAEASRETERAGVIARLAAAEGMAEAMRAAVHARKMASHGLIEGARGMEQGAEGMEHGAREMCDEARRLNSEAHRDRRIAEAKTRGKRLTHEELLESIAELNEGASDLTEAAKDLRRAAADMRRRSAI